MPSGDSDPNRMMEVDNAVARVPSAEEEENRLDLLQPIKSVEMLFPELEHSASMAPRERPEAVPETSPSPRDDSADAHASPRSDASSQGLYLDHLAPINSVEMLFPGSDVSTSSVAGSRAGAHPPSRAGRSSLLQPGASSALARNPNAQAFVLKPATPRTSRTTLRASAARHHRTTSTSAQCVYNSASKLKMPHYNGPLPPFSTPGKSLLTELLPELRTPFPSHPSNSIPALSPPQTPKVWNAMDKEPEMGPNHLKKMHITYDSLGKGSATLKTMVPPWLAAGPREVRWEEDGAGSQQPTDGEPGAEDVELHVAESERLLMVAVKALPLGAQIMFNKLPYKIVGWACDDGAANHSTAGTALSGILTMSGYLLAGAVGKAIIRTCFHHICLQQPDFTRMLRESAQEVEVEHLDQGEMTAMQQKITQEVQRIAFLESEIRDKCASLVPLLLSAEVKIKKALEFHGGLYTEITSSRCAVWHHLLPGPCQPPEASPEPVFQGTRNKAWEWVSKSRRHRQAFSIANETSISRKVAGLLERYQQHVEEQTLLQIRPVSPLAAEKSSIMLDIEGVRCEGGGPDPEGEAGVVQRGYASSPGGVTSPAARFSYSVAWWAVMSEDELEAGDDGEPYQDEQLISFCFRVMYQYVPLFQHSIRKRVEKNATMTAFNENEKELVEELMMLKETGKADRERWTVRHKGMVTLLDGMNKLLREILAMLSYLSPELGAKVWEKMDTTLVIAMIHSLERDKTASILAQLEHPSTDLSLLDREDAMIVVTNAPPGVVARSFEMLPTATSIAILNYFEEEDKWRVVNRVTEYMRSGYIAGMLELLSPEDGVRQMLALPVTHRVTVMIGQKGEAAAGLLHVGRILNLMDTSDACALFQHMDTEGAARLLQATEMKVCAAIIGHLGAQTLNIFLCMEIEAAVKVMTMMDAHQAVNILLAMQPLQTIDFLETIIRLDFDCAIIYLNIVEVETLAFLTDLGMQDASIAKVLTAFEDDHKVRLCQLCRPGKLALVLICLEPQPAAGILRELRMELIRGTLQKLAHVDTAAGARILASWEIKDMIYIVESLMRAARTQFGAYEQRAEALALQGDELEEEEILAEIEKFRQQMLEVHYQLGGQAKQQLGAILQKQVELGSASAFAGASAKFVTSSLDEAAASAAVIKRWVDLGLVHNVPSTSTTEIDEKTPPPDIQAVEEGQQAVEEGQESADPPSTHPLDEMDDAAWSDVFFTDPLFKEDGAPAFLKSEVSAKWLAGQLCKRSALFGSVLLGQVPPQVAAVGLNQISLTRAAAMLSYLSPELGAKVWEKMDTTLVIAMIHSLERDKTASILAQLEHPSTDLSLLDREDAMIVVTNAPPGVVARSFEMLPTATSIAILNYFEEEDKWRVVNRVTEYMRSGYIAGMLELLSPEDGVRQMLALPVTHRVTVMIGQKGEAAAGLLHDLELPEDVKAYLKEYHDSTLECREEWDQDCATLLMVMEETYAVQILNHVELRTANVLLRGMKNKDQIRFMSLMQTDRIASLMEAMPIKVVAVLLRSCDAPTGSYLLTTVNPVNIASVFEMLKLENASDILGAMTAEKGASVFDAMSGSQWTASKGLLEWHFHHHEHSCVQMMAALRVDQAQELMSLLLLTDRAHMLSLMTTDQATNIIQAMSPSKAVVVLQAMEYERCELPPQAESVMKLITALQTDPDTALQVLRELKEDCEVADYLEAMDSNLVAEVVLSMETQEAVHTLQLVSDATVGAIFSHLAPRQLSKTAELLNLLPPQKAVCGIRQCEVGVGAEVLIRMGLQECIKVMDLMTAEEVGERLVRLHPKDTALPIANFDRRHEVAKMLTMEHRTMAKSKILWERLGKSGSLARKLEHGMFKFKLMLKCLRKLHILELRMDFTIVKMSRATTAKRGDLGVLLCLFLLTFPTESQVWFSQLFARDLPSADAAIKLGYTAVTKRINFVEQHIDAVPTGDSMMERMIELVNVLSERGRYCTLLDEDGVIQAKKIIEDTLALEDLVEMSTESSLVYFWCKAAIELYEVVNMVSSTDLTLRSGEMGGGQKRPSLRSRFHDSVYKPYNAEQIPMEQLSYEVTKRRRNNRRPSILVRLEFQYQPSVRIVCTTPMEVGIGLPGSC
eukprot:gene1444-2065_t